MNSLSSAHPKEIKSKQTFQYGNKTIEYNLIQSKRRKTCEVIVDKDEITIRAPFDKSINEIEQILNDKIKWISQKQKEIQNEKPEIIKPSFDDYSTLPYLGKNYDLKIIYNMEQSEKEKIEFEMTFLDFIINKKENKSNDKNKIYSIMIGYSLKLINYSKKRLINIVRL